MSLPILPDSFSASRRLRLYYVEHETKLRLLAQALRDSGEHDRQFPPIIVPLLPSRMVERCAGLIRAMWRTTGTQMIVLCYLGTANSQWRDLVPRQACGRDTVHCTFGGSTHPPLEPHFRLAGTFRAARFDEFCPDTDIPAFDGLHVVFDPEPDWIRLAAFRRVGGQLNHARAEEVIYNDDTDRLNALMPQLTVSSTADSATRS